MSERTRDYFEFFGLDRKLVIDADELQKRFYELSRQWHPDRFSRRPRKSRIKRWKRPRC